MTVLLGILKDHPQKVPWRMHTLPVPAHVSDTMKEAGCGPHIVDLVFMSSIRDACELFFVDCIGAPAACIADKSDHVNQYMAGFSQSADQQHCSREL